MSDTSKTDNSRRAGRKKKRKTVRRLIVLVFVLSILGLGGYVVIRKLQADYQVTYDPYTATIGTILKSLSYSGSLQLTQNTIYTASSECKVREVYVTAGQQIQQGEKLIRLSDGTTLTADFNGIVNKVEVSKGDVVHSGTSLVQVTDFDHMKVSFRIGENDIKDVKAGQHVQITVASINATFDAEISNIDYSSYTGNSVAYYTADILVDASGIDDIYPGMQATITVPQEEARDVVILKMDAISAAEDNSAFVYKQSEDGSMTRAAVTVGLSNGNYAEIKSGISAGETVYVEKEQEASTFESILSGLFGSQQVNAPSGGNSRGSGGGSFSERPSGSGSFSPGERNRGN